MAYRLRLRVKIYCRPKKTGGYAKPTKPKKPVRRGDPHRDEFNHEFDHDNQWHSGSERPF